MQSKAQILNLLKCAIDQTSHKTPNFLGKILYIFSVVVYNNLSLVTIYLILCCIKIHTKEFETNVLQLGFMGGVLVFENFLVRYCGQNISKSSFFNHIWTHLPGVNGFLLEPFMTCNNFSHPLCWKKIGRLMKVFDHC